MKFVVVVVLALCFAQVALSTNVALRLLTKTKAPADGSSAINSYLQSVAQSAVAQSAAAAAAAGAASEAGSVESIPATKLEGGSGSLGSTSSSAALSAAASAGSGSGCQAVSNCGISFNGDSQNSASENQGLSVDDAVKPIEDWMKDFKARTNGNGADLHAAAAATIAPLINKLKHNQEVALEKLEESNSAILEHVQETATEHVYNLLRAERIKSDNEDAAAAKKQKLEALKSEAAEKQLETKILSEESSAEHSEHSEHSSSSSSSSSSKKK